MKQALLLIICLAWSLATTSQTASFTPVGPVKFPANPSVQTTGMGRVSQLIYHPTDSNIIFAVTASGGVFKSANEGATWCPISDFLPQTACASLAINPLKPSVMYLGTGDANYNGGGLGVWKSNDGGASWFQSTTGMGNKLVSYILFSPTDTNTLLAACSDGIYKSINAGSTWVKKTTVSTSYRDLKYRPQSNSIVYSATNTNFYRSYDNGETWISSVINAAITCAGIKIAVCASDTSRLYTLVWKSGTNPFGGVYLSSDNGSSFTLKADTPNIMGYSSDGTSMDGQGSYNMAIATDPRDANTLYVGAINVWKSVNQGAAFTLKSHWGYGVHADKHGILFSPYNPNKIFVYHDGGLDRSNDGGNTWTTLEDGLSASEFYKMGSSGLYNDYIIGGLQDNGQDVSTNKRFSTVRGGDYTGDFEFDAFDSSIVYEHGSIKRNLVNHVTGSINGHGGLYKVHPTDSNVLFELTSNIYRAGNLRASPTTAVSWTQIGTIPGSTAPQAMAYCKNSSGTLYVACSSQLFYRCENANSASPVFTKITTFPYNSGEQIRQLETYDYDSNAIYALTTSSRILKSTDKGATWTSLNKNLPANTILKFLLSQRAVDSSMYACTAFGVYYRNRFTGNWISFSQGLPTIAQITDMEIVSNPAYPARLHVSTYGRGIWQTDLYRSSPTAPVAEFTIHPSTAQPCVNTIILVDNSTGAPTSRKWQVFPSTGWSYINGTDSFSARPELRFNTPATYFISLTATNNKGSNTKTQNYSYSTLTLAPGCTTTTNLLGGYTIGIYRFELNTIDKSSATGNVSYEDFSCAASTQLRAGGTYTAWITNGNNYAENAKIYIDYNGNGVFTDANEQVATLASGLGRRSCTFTVLSNPLFTNRFLRMRVVSDYNNVTGSCGTLSYGQSEDYVVLIDKSKPVVSISIPKPTVSKSFQAYFSVSEYVSGFDLSDLSVINATLSNFTQIDALNYSVKVTPIDNGKVYLGVNPGTLSDLTGNLNDAVSDSTTFFLGISSYTFSGLSVHDSIVQTAGGGSIWCDVPFGTVCDALKADFVLSDSSIAYVGAVIQTTGVSANDHRTVVTYTVKTPDNSLSKTYTVTVNVRKNTACKLLTYALVTPAVNGSITQTSGGGSVSVVVPYGTSLNALNSLFTLSDSATAFVGSVKQVSGSNTNNFIGTVTYRIVAQDTNYVSFYTVTVNTGKSVSCDLLTYAMASPAVNGVITPGAGGGNVLVTVPYGTSLNSLTALFTLSDSATAYVSTLKQVSGTTTNNFVGTVTYRIVAQDTNYSKIYNVTVKIAPNTAALLLTYNLLNPAATGTILPTADGGMVLLDVPFATALGSLVASFTLSDSATAYVSTVKQSSGITANNFADTVVLTVKAQDGVSIKTYKIKVRPAKSAACDLLTYALVTPAVNGVITPTFNGGTVAITVPFSTVLTNLVSRFTVSDSAKVNIGAVPQVSQVSANDFTLPVTYTIKSQDGTQTKTYVVTVSRNTGITQSHLPMGLHCYPNPAGNVLHLDFEPGTAPHQSSFVLVDMTGQALNRGFLNADGAVLDLSGFSSGVYTLHLICEGQSYTLRVVKR